MIYATTADVDSQRNEEDAGADDAWTDGDDGASSSLIDGDETKTIISPLLLHSLLTLPQLKSRSPSRLNL